MTAAGYVGSLRQIAENVRELCPDEDVAADLYLLIYNRKGLTRLVRAGGRGGTGAAGSGSGCRSSPPSPRNSSLGARRSPAGRTAQAVGCGTRAGRRRGRKGARAAGSGPTPRPRKRQPGKAASSRRVVEGAVRRYGREYVGG